MLSTELTPVSTPTHWRISPDPISYPDAVQQMEERVAGIIAGTAPEQIWLLEHPPLYTAGTSAKDSDLVDARFPVFKSGRGGQYTYHGPGQRIAYVMLDLKSRKPDVRTFVHDLEEWIIRALAEFGIIGERRNGRVGIWVAHSDGREEKIAAIGVRLRHWVTFHGISVNVAPNLSHFSGIVPCGISDTNLGVTSLSALGLHVSTADVDSVLRRTYERVFGPTVED